jgi:predicted PurR-regulated permease PerM/ActR/RegA family two-component response regulator
MAMADEARFEAWTQVRAILRVLSIVLAVLAGLWLLYALAGVIALVVCAIIFAYVLSPAVALLQRIPLFGGRPWSRTVAIVMVYLGLFGGLTLTAYALAPRFGAQLAELGDRAPGYVEAARDRAQALVGAYQAYSLPLGVKQAIESAATRALGSFVTSVQQAVSAVLGWLRFAPWLVLVPILAFFFLKDASSFQRFALHVLPEGRIRWRGRDFIDEIHRTLALYVRAQIIACILIGLVCWIGFSLLGLPYALILGALAGLLEFIPLVGPVIVAVVAGFLASLSSGTLAGMTVLFLAALRIGQDYVVYPRLVAHGMKLHPLAIILTLVCGSHLAGVAGMFLAIPAAALLMVAYRHLLLQLGRDNLLAAIVEPKPKAEPEPVQVAAPCRPAVVPALDSEVLSGISVMVVDNDGDARRLVVELLEQCGAVVFPAASAAAALELLERSQPDVLISDLAMPGQDGFDLIRSVRALPPGRGGELRAAALSGYATPEDRSRTLAAGFQEHLSKPVDLDKLIQTVRALATAPSAALAR